jgi:H+/Cl- antiporter ClcA
MCSTSSQQQLAPAIACYELAVAQCSDPTQAVCVQPTSSLGNPLASVQVWCDPEAWTRGDDPTATKSTCVTGTGYAADLCATASITASSLCQATGGTPAGCVATIVSVDASAGQVLWRVSPQCQQPSGQTPARTTLVLYGAPLYAPTTL